MGTRSDGFGADMVGCMIGAASGMALAAGGYGLGKGWNAFNEWRGPSVIGDGAYGRSPSYPTYADDIVQYPPGVTNTRGYSAGSGRVSYIDPEGTAGDYAGLNQPIADHNTPAIDIPTRFTDNGRWAGPAQEFRVLEARGTTDWATGSMVRVQFRNGDQLYFGHLTSISKQVKAAVNIDTYLPERTFLGRTSFRLGFANGPHLHVEGRLASGRIMPIDQIHRYLRGY